MLRDVLKPSQQTENILRNYDWRRALNHAVNLAVENKRKGYDIRDEDLAWELLREAAKVSAIAYSGPPRSGMPTKSTMPDAPDEVTWWQISSAYIRGDLDEIPEARARQPQPTSEQITRASMVLDVWHFKAMPERQGSKRKAAVYMKACGAPDRKITAVMGPEFTRHKLRAYKDECAQDMARFMFSHLK